MDRSPSAAVTFAASADSQGQAVEHAVEQARRVAARGADAVVIVDSLEYVSPAVARRALAAARNIVDGGSLTVIASAPAALGGETTVIALDAALIAMGRFPALDLANSGTMRPELLVGDAGAEAIAKARADTAAAKGFACQASRKLLAFGDVTFAPSGSRSTSRGTARPST